MLVFSRADMTIKRLPKTIYENLTVRRLASRIGHLTATDEANDPQGTSHRISKTNDVFKSNSLNLPAPRQFCLQHRQSPLVVLLTGSTGSLGSYLLDAIVKDSSIPKTYCLNRTTDSEKRQLRSHACKGLSTGWSNVSFITCDLSKANLGVELSTYNTLLEEVTHVVHNAWEVNFNLALDSFLPHLKGVYQLIKFSSESFGAPRSSSCP